MTPQFLKHWALWFGVMVGVIAAPVGLAAVIQLAPAWSMGVLVLLMIAFFAALIASETSE